MIDDYIILIYSNILILIYDLYLSFIMIDYRF